MAKILNASTDTNLGGNNASDIVISSQKATKTYIDNKIQEVSNAGFSIESPALTPVDGVCTWTINHNLNSTRVICSLYLNDSEIEKDVDIISSDTIIISFNSNENLLAGDCTAIILVSNGSIHGDISDLANTNLSNLSTTGKSVISNSSLLDYYHAVNLTPQPVTDTIYLVPVDGVLSIACTHVNNEIGFVQVQFLNQNEEGINVIRGGISGNLDSLVVNVKKGEKIKIQFSSLNQWFWIRWIPYYGVS